MSEGTCGDRGLGREEISLAVLRFTRLHVEYMSNESGFGPSTPALKKMYSPGEILGLWWALRQDSIHVVGLLFNTYIHEMSARCVMTRAWIVKSYLAVRPVECLLHTASAIMLDVI